MTKFDSDPTFRAAAFIAGTAAGSLALAVSDKGLARLFFCSREHYLRFLEEHSLSDGKSSDSLLAEATRQVLAYFDGRLRAFDLPLDLSGQSPFRTRALQACAIIPFGATITYGKLAARAGSPTAARAAGGAMAHNPIALVIPCHRVVGSDRGLHGFSSPGGLGTKAILLRHEGFVIKNERIVIKE